MQIKVNDDQPASILDVAWRKDGHLARLVADMETKVFHVYCTRTADDGELRCVSSLSCFQNFYFLHLPLLAALLLDD